MNRVQVSSTALGVLSVSACALLTGVRAAPVGCLTPEQEAILSRMQLVQLDDGQGGSVGTVRFSSVNLQIVDGSGSTSGAVTGVGNLIVGYNELGHPASDDRTGSHNIVVGLNNNYSSFGGLVVGHQNSVTARFATVVGGSGNQADGEYSSVSGGQFNRTTNLYAHVGGGLSNIATGEAASVTGGHLNVASGNYSSVGGGVQNEAQGLHAAVSGGRDNLASGNASTVSGGRHNHAQGGNAAVGGGFDNLASGTASAVSGGQSRSAPAAMSWAAGSLYEID